MNTDNMIIELLKLFLQNEEKDNKSPERAAGEATSVIGKKVLLRCHLSGVWAGTLIEQGENHVVIVDATRGWRWYVDGEGVGCASLAKFGITDDSVVERADWVRIGETPVEIHLLTNEAALKWASRGKKKV